MNAGPGNDTIDLFDGANVVRGGDGTDTLSFDLLSTEIQLFSTSNDWFLLSANGGFFTADFTGIENIQLNDGLFLTSEIPLTTVPVPAAV